MTLGLVMSLRVKLVRMVLFVLPEVSFVIIVIFHNPGWSVVVVPSERLYVVPVSSVMLVLKLEPFARVICAKIVSILKLSLIMAVMFIVCP